MKKLLTLCLLCFVCLFTISANQTPKTFEYKFEYKCTEKKANEHAAQGWEIVTVNDGPAGFSLCVFKR